MGLRNPFSAADNDGVKSGTSPARVELARSLTLLKVFVVASAAILTVGARVSLTQYVNGVLHDELVQDGRVSSAKVSGLVERDLRSRSDILSVKVWAPDGTLAWTNLEPERIGTRYPVEGHLAEAVREGHAEAEL